VPDTDSEDDNEGEKETVAHDEEHAEWVPVVLPLREPEYVPEWEGVALPEREPEELCDTVAHIEGDGVREGELEVVPHAEGVVERDPVVLPLREPE
jgi:hypothetical protein